MATKKGFLKQKTGANSFDILLPHTSSDIVALSTNITVGGSSKSNVQAALEAINALANSGGSHASTNLDATHDPHGIKLYLANDVIGHTVPQYYSGDWTDSSDNAQEGYIVVGRSTEGGTVQVKQSDKTISDLIAIAEGRTKTWVVSGSLNSTLQVATTTDASQTAYNTKTITSLKTGTGSGTEVISQVHVGDIILLTDVGYCDWWVGAISTSGNTTTVTVYRLESQKHDLSGYALKTTTITASDGLTYTGGTLGQNTVIKHAAGASGGASKTSGFYKIATDAYGHVSSVTAVTKSDLTALGVSGNTGFKVCSGVNSSGNDIVQEGFTLDGNTINLADSGVAAGTYSAVQVNSKGIVINGAQFFQVIANGGSTTNVATGGFYFEQDAAA